MIKKSLSIFLLMVFTLLPMASLVIADDLVINGTFDTDMTGWDTDMSQNFTITAEGGFCEMNTTDTDWLFDYATNWTTPDNHSKYNLNFENYRTVVVPSITTITDVMTLENTTRTVVSNPVFNTTEIPMFNGTSNWTYEEYQPTNDFIQSVSNATLFTSSDRSISFEAKRLTNSTIPVQLDEGLYQGNGSSSFIYNATGDYIDCQHNSGDFSRYYWSLPHQLGLSNEFGATFEIQRNTTAIDDDDSYIEFGFFNATQYGDYNSMWLEIRVIGDSSFVANTKVYDETGALTSGTASQTWGLSNLTHGVRLDLYYDLAQEQWEWKIFNKTSDHYLGGGFADASAGSDIFMNHFGISNNDWFIGSSVEYNTYIDNIEYWIDVDDRPTTAMSYYNQTISLDPDDYLIRYQANRNMWHDAQSGFSYLNTSFMNETSIDYDKKTFSGSGFTGWDMWDGIATTKGELNISIESYHTLTEGSSEFPAKVNYVDDFYVNATNYDDNGTFTSVVFTQDYFADWKTLEIYYLEPDYWDDIYGTGTIIEDITNWNIETRVGDSEIPDLDWTAWQDADFQTDIVNPLGDTSGTVIGRSGVVASTNGVYIQYRISVDTQIQDYTPEIFGVGISSTPIAVAEEFGIISQDIVKPYTTWTEINYDFKIQELNNSDRGNLTISFGGIVLEKYNFTYYESDWIEREWNLTTFNASGLYELEFNLQGRFNSTNGTMTVLFDNIEVIVEDQAPVITLFEVYNGTEIGFNGTFRDITKGSDYDYLGLDGIETVNITVDGTVLEIEDITYLGNGEFAFNYTWENTPFEVAESIITNATLTVRDKAGLEDQATDSITMPSAIQFLMAFLYAGIVIIIIVLVLARHMGTEWDTDKKKSDQGILPTTLTGKKGK